jgi:hypothetical protein
MRNFVVSESILMLAGAYIMDNEVIKYRWYSNDPSEVDSMLGQICISDPLSLKTYSFRDMTVEEFGFTRDEVDQAIKELMDMGDNVVVQTGKHLTVYTNKYFERKFREILSKYEEGRYYIDCEIIVRERKKDEV